jgi:hypothetical protein
MAAPTTDGTRRAASLPPPASPAPRRAGRNRTRIILGAALMIVSALAAAVIYADAGEREAYLVVAKRVPAGQVIAADDFSETLAAIDGINTPVRASAMQSVVGRIATVDLLPGSLLSAAQVSDRAPDTATDAVIAARLDEGRAPTDLVVGDAVLLYEVPADGADADAVSAPVAGRIVSIEAATDGSAVVASIAVSPNEARRAAVAAARGRLTVVLAPR